MNKYQKIVKKYTPSYVKVKTYRFPMKYMTYRSMYYTDTDTAEIEVPRVKSTYSMFLYLHELGHAIHDRNGDKNFAKENKIRQWFINEKAVSFDKEIKRIYKLLFIKEWKAWQFAVKIAEKNNIKISKLIWDKIDDCLDTYIWHTIVLAAYGTWIKEDITEGKIYQLYTVNME